MTASTVITEQAPAKLNLYLHVLGRRADGYHELHRWLGIIGLKREGALRGFGRNGETFHQFAWVADDVG